MKILIVKVSALGDVVHALPVLAHLHEAHPGVTIDWLVESAFAPLLEGHPMIRRVIKLDTKAWRAAGGRAALAGARAVVRQLQAEAYDLALDLQGNSKSGLFTRFSGARKRYGFNRDQVREWPNLLATTDKVAIPDSCRHISSRYLQIARVALPSTAEVELAGPLPVQPAAAEAIARQLDEAGLAGKPFVVGHYGTTWKTKLWPLACWQELAAALVGLGWPLVLTWGNAEERAAAEAIRSATHDQALIWPRGSLPELVALLAAARLVIGADTGPIHIAAAVGTPTVSFYRVTDSLRNGPSGDRHLVLQSSLSCSPCLQKSCEHDGECGQSIPVAVALAAVRKQLATD